MRGIITRRYEQDVALKDELDKVQDYSTVLDSAAITIKHKTPQFPNHRAQAQTGELASLQLASHQVKSHRIRQ